MFIFTLTRRRVGKAILLPLSGGEFTGNHPPRQINRWLSLSPRFPGVSARFFTNKGGDMQYMMTGVVIVIISGLVIHLIALAIEGLYKVISNRTTWR
ncbi:TPA: hypothetical protein QHS21_001395 [Klebsiella michiganensis]|nr:hypothetical protein [Klebsiella michiganensis]